VYREDISAFKREVYEGRFGSVLLASEDLSAIRIPLRAGWDVRRYTFGLINRPARNDDEEAKRVKVEQADKAITEKTMWAYCVMLAFVSQVLLGTMAWAELCPCHPKPFHFESPPRWTRRKRMYERTKHRDCPFETRRAAEAAAGDLEEEVARLFRIAQQMLLLCEAMEGLSEDVMTLIIDDFVALRRHCLFVFKVKFSFWRQLPYVLFGIAHFIPEKARSCARRALRLANRIDWAAGDSKPHYITCALVREGTLGKIQLLLFIGGRDICEFPYLSSWACIFLLATISERWIESRHAMTMWHLLTARHVSPVHIAHGTGLKAIRDLLEAQPDALQVLAERAMEVRNPVCAVQTLGLWHSPRMRELRNRRSLSEMHKKARRDIVNIIYHCDARTNYQPLLQVQHQDDDDPPPRGFLDCPDYGSSLRDSSEGGPGEPRDPASAPEPEEEERMQDFVEAELQDQSRSESVNPAVAGATRFHLATSSQV